MQSGMFDTRDSGMSHFSSQVWGIFNSLSRRAQVSRRPSCCTLTSSRSPSHPLQPRVNRLRSASKRCGDPTSVCGSLAKVSNLHEPSGCYNGLISRSSTGRKPGRRIKGQFACRPSIPRPSQGFAVAWLVGLRLLRTSSSSSPRECLGWDLRRIFYQ
jgi:hypothetical protein